MTKTIKLTEGYEAVVDDQDFERLNAHEWKAFVNRKKTSRVYARRYEYCPSPRKITCFYMHREVLGADCDQVDHIDGNGLNNQRHNLREATYNQNAHNVGKRRDNKSGVKGVFWEKRRAKWVAKLECFKKHYYCGEFDTLQAATEAVRAKREELHGEFCNHG